MLHCRLLDNSAVLQQEAVGVLGVNFIHSALSKAAKPYDVRPETLFTDVVSILSIPTGRGLTVKQNTSKNGRGMRGEMALWLDGCLAGCVLYLRLVWFSITSLADLMHRPFAAC